MIFLIYTILVILQLYKGIATVVPDPCPDYVKNSDIVVDMCKSSSATEEANSGYKVDSVVLRIMTQQDDCICRVMIDNQNDTISVGIRKCDGLTASTPEKADCGLAVHINHIPDMSTGNVIAPIECLVNDTIRHTPLFQKSYLQFRSRIINGDFIRGFCIRIIRDSNNDHSQVLRIACDAPMTTEQTTKTITTSDAPPSSSQTPVSEKSTTISSNIDTTTTVTTEKSTTNSSNIDTTTTVTTEKSTTNSSNIDTTTNVTTTNVKHQSIATSTDRTTGLEQTTYIAIGAGVGVTLILLVVLVVICLRRKSTQKAGTNGYVDNSHQQEESDDKLPDNVLYVPAGEFDITGGKCSTADVDISRSSNKGLSMEGNYSIVDDDIPKSSNKRLSMEGDYSTVGEDTQISIDERLSVEGNYSTVDEDRPKSSNKRISMEGEYSTVDEDTRISLNERLSVEGNYSTVDEDMPKTSKNRISMDGDYSIVELDEHLDTNCSYPENSELGQTKGKQKPTIKPKPKSSCKNSEANSSLHQNIKHVTPPNGSDNVYAIVDKSSKDVLTTNVGKGEGTFLPDQTYAVVDKALKRKSSSDETNKKKFEINSGNRA